MEEKPKRQTLWEKKNNFPAEVFRPYTVETDLAAVKENCAICQSEPCCPEHCCDWDSCTCNDCDHCRPAAAVEQSQKQSNERPASAYRRTFDTKTWSHKFEPTEDPEILIKKEGERVEVNQFKKKNLDLLNKKERAAVEKEMLNKDYMDTLPKEIIHCNEQDGAMIYNFEVDAQEEEEIAMTGGIRGIKALRIQRQLINEQIAVDPKIVSKGKNRFAQYEREEKKD